MSDRYVRLTDEALTQPWLLGLGRLRTDGIVLGLRFSKSYDATLVETQLDSVAKARIDPDKALQSGTSMVTHGYVGTDLKFPSDQGLCWRPSC
jgi:hypothetical protein